MTLKPFAICPIDRPVAFRSWWQGARALLITTVQRVVSDERTPDRRQVPPSTIVIGSRTVVLIGPQKRIVVAPPPRAAWDDQGWTARSHPGGRVYEGEYRVGAPTARARRHFAGRIVQQHRPATITAYIADPPPELRQHPKGACFQLTEPPWFCVHWQRAPSTVDDALLYVEGVLGEALRTSTHFQA